MEKMINIMNIPDCTVGLYLGGMKQENLDISATKRVIIATFNMAEEAFDCKTLNTLIYATPHNNIEQAVGRILREEKKKRQYIPLIIDLQDTFSSFLKWNKLREKYYKSKGYPMKIYEVNDSIKQITPIITFIKDVINDTKKSKKKIATTNTHANTHSVCDLDDADKVDEADEVDF
jgi:superfamily II DNA or RNA helicase